MPAKILIVDDEEPIRELIKEILFTQGYEIAGEAADGEEAIEMYKKFKPDLVIMDLLLPKLNGQEALKRILEIDSKAKVIILTAMSRINSTRDLIEGGACDFIIKPFSKDRMLQSIENTLKNA